MNKDQEHESIHLSKNRNGQFVEKILKADGKPGTSLVKDLDAQMLQVLSLEMQNDINKKAA